MFEKQAMLAKKDIDHDDHDDHGDHGDHDHDRDHEHDHDHDVLFAITHRLAIVFNKT